MVNTSSNNSKFRGKIIKFTAFYGSIFIINAHREHEVYIKLWDNSKLNFVRYNKIINMNVYAKYQKIRN